MTRTRSIWIKSLVAGLLILVGSLYLASRAATLSVAIGIAIAVANFWLLERLVKGLINREATSLAKLLGIFIAKAAILFGVLGYVVLKVPIEVGPFLFGLSCVVAGIVLEGIWGLVGPQPQKDI